MNPGLPRSIRFDERVSDRLNAYVASHPGWSRSSAANRFVDEALRMADHPGVIFRDVIAVVEDSVLVGTSDEDLLAHATAGGRLLVTANVREFAAINASWSSRGRSHAGPIYIVQPGVPKRPLIRRRHRHSTRRHDRGQPAPSGRRGDLSPSPAASRWFTYWVDIIALGCVKNSGQVLGC